LLFFSSFFCQNPHPPHPLIPSPSFKTTAIPVQTVTSTVCLLRPVCMFLPLGSTFPISKQSVLNDRLFYGYWFLVPRVTALKDIWLCNVLMNVL
jgi:hypothetical protein